MTRDEIISGIKTCLDEHHGSVGRGSMHQEPYKGDLFRFFKNAYRNGLLDAGAEPSLTAERLAENLVERWYTGDERENEKKAELIHQLHSFWAEWQYAWDHYETT